MSCILLIFHLTPAPGQVKGRLPDIGGNIIIPRSIPNSLINLILRSTSSLELVGLGLSTRQRLLYRPRVVYYISRVKKGREE